MSGYQPDPALEDATWAAIVSPCGAVVGRISPDRTVLRHRCIDRRCRRPGEARLSYFDLGTDPPVELTHIYVAVRVDREEGTRNGE